MSQTTVLVDFDHTLYNSPRYLRAMFDNLLAGSDVSWRSFKRSFEAYTDMRRERPLSPVAFFSQEFSTSVRQEDVERFLRKESGNFLYRDSLPFLKTLSRRGYHIAVVTFAERESRALQIRTTGVHSYVDEVHIFENHLSEKIEFIRRYARGGHAILIDDHPVVISGVQGSSVLPIRLQRRVYSKYIGREPDLHGCRVVRSLKQASRVLATIASDAGQATSL